MTLQVSGDAPDASQDFLQVVWRDEEGPQPGIGAEIAVADFHRLRQAVNEFGDVVHGLRNRLAQPLAVVTQCA
jgi:hypothetical protein